MTEDGKAFLFESCCSLDGHVHRVNLARRNKRPMAILGPEWILPNLEPSAESHDSHLRELRDELCVNLNPVERRTWEQIIDGWSISDIARAERKSRTAVYERIRGKGQGGMVAKNPYVALWWCQRLRKQIP